MWDPNDALPPDATPAERLAAYTVAELQRSSMQGERVEDLLLRVEAALEANAARPTMAEVIRCAMETQQGAIIGSGIAQALAWVLISVLAYSSGAVQFLPITGGP